MQDLIQKARWLIGVAWTLSWFQLYLEIYRYHHVTASLVRDLPASRGIGATARPGVWLLSVLACSALAPPLFAALLLWTRFRHEDSSDTPLPTPMTLTAFGILLCVLAAINQLIRHPPIDVDLTLRRGNGGFVILGVVLVFVGVMLARLKNRYL